MAHEHLVVGIPAAHHRHGLAEVRVRLGEAHESLEVLVHHLPEHALHLEAGHCPVLDLEDRGDALTQCVLGEDQPVGVVLLGDLTLQPCPVGDVGTLGALVPLGCRVRVLPLRLEVQEIRVEGAEGVPGEVQQGDGVRDRPQDLLRVVAQLLVVLQMAAREDLCLLYTSPSPRDRG